MKKCFYGFETKVPTPSQDSPLTMYDIPSCSSPFLKALTLMVIFIFRCQFLLSQAWEGEMQTGHSCMRDPR